MSEREFWSDAAELAIRQSILEGLSATQTAKNLSEKFHRIFSRGMCLAKGWRMVRDGSIEQSFNSQGKHHRLVPVQQASELELEDIEPIAINQLAYKLIPLAVNWINPLVYNHPLLPHAILSKPIDLSSSVSLLNAKPSMCHWPVSDDPGLGEAFMVCGKVVEKGRSYCEECLGFAFSKRRKM